MKYLIAGLGNIGDKYAHTRHNVGFDCLDYIASKYDFKFENDRFGELGNSKFRGRNLYFLKPDTFMNLSGNAIGFWMRKLDIPLNHLIVITDDLNLPFGKIRMKPKGSHGGHNGLRNIESVLNSQQYPRIRVGIGSDFKTGEQVDFVLSKWLPDEEEILQNLYEKIRLGIEETVFRGIGMAMNSLNANY
ncbi:MAG: aminoacyl-tRNA hydrolase [Bacteroidetes bacterium]|nr:aminoacyl-tRNA hydrolase [Bacteroidota bacterium]